MTMAASPFRTMLLLVDGTEPGMRAAEFAVQMARTTQARLVAISVVDTDTLRKLMSVRILVEQEMSEFETQLGASRKRELDFVEHLARKAKVPIQTALRSGVCHSMVLAEQKEIGADLVIVGGFRVSLTKHDLAARERQLILDEAPCPVLVVK